MLETIWSGFSNDSTAYWLALVATIASYHLASLWTNAFLDYDCRRFEQ